MSSAATRNATTRKRAAACRRFATAYAATIASVGKPTYALAPPEPRCAAIEANEEPPTATRRVGTAKLSRSEPEPWDSTDQPGTKPSAA